MKKSEILEKGKNELITWCNTISCDENTIIYLEHVFIHKNNQEIENWIKVLDTKNDELLYPLIKNYILSIKDEKIDNLKLFLKKNKIEFEEGFWDTVEGK